MRLYTDEQVKVIENALRAILITADDLEMHSTKRRTEAALATLRSGQDVTGEAFAYCNQADIDKLKADKWACVEVSAYKVDGSENIPLHLAAPTQSAQPLITVESSLRFRLESEKQKSADLLDEVRELKGKLSTQSAQIPADLSNKAQDLAAEFRGNVACKDYEAWGRDVLKLLDWMTFSPLSASPQPPQDVARDAALAELKQASDFYLLVKEDKEGNAASTGAVKDAHKWLIDSALAVAVIAAQGGK